MLLSKSLVLSLTPLVTYESPFSDMRLLFLAGACGGLSTGFIVVEILINMESSTFHPSETGTAGTYRILRHHK